MGERVEVDVCVVGGGPVGGTLAARLASAGVRTALVEQGALPPMEHPDFDGRAYAVSTGSRSVLEAADVWDGLPFPANPIRRIRVSDGRLGRPTSPLDLGFNADDAGAQAFGWMVEARSLRMALNARLHGLPALTLIAPGAAEDTAVEPKGRIVRLAGGTTVHARLVVAAEGRRSPLRAQAGIRMTERPYGQTGIVFAIAHDHPHDDTALQNFLPGGPIARLPMAPTEVAEHVSSIVWTERSDLARHVLGAPPARFAREVARRLGDELGEIRLVGRRWSYPLSVMIAHSLWAPRLAVVGDAAHGIHPIAGQGLNLGFQDIDALAGLVIAAVGAGEDPGGEAVLRRYAAARSPEVLSMTALTDGLDRLFSNDTAPLRMARDLGIAVVDRIAPLKRFLMRRAMG